MLAVGRALMIEPKMLLLDEPTAGLSPMYMSEIFDRVLAVNASGVTILMVEQNARQALAIAHRGFILANGENSWTAPRPGTACQSRCRPQFPRRLNRILRKTG